MGSVRACMRASACMCPVCARMHIQLAYACVVHVCRCACVYICVVCVCLCVLQIHCSRELSFHLLCQIRTFSEGKDCLSAFILL